MKSTYVPNKWQGNAGKERGGASLGPLSSDELPVGAPNCLEVQHTHTVIHTPSLTHTHTYIHTQSNIHTHAYTHSHTHSPSLTHTNTHTQSHTHMQVYII